MSAEKNNSVKKKDNLRIPQNKFPRFTLEDAIIIPKAVKDNFAGQPTNPLLVAEACDISPTSSNWRTLTGSSVAYGLTKGGYNSKEISVDTLGERIVAPLTEGDDLIAMEEAVLKPTILRDFFKKYNKNKFPKREIAINILKSKGVPRQRVESFYEILRKNALKTNILRVIRGSEFIILGNLDYSPAVDSSEDSNEKEEIEIPKEVLEKIDVTAPQKKELISVLKREKPHIFISHGKHNNKIIGQLKELIIYGQMEPVISVEREATAIPVPDKVFDDMRSCDAGIIHIESEEKTLVDGNKYNAINENVLIEIGAAIALYSKRVILLCKKETSLPSNLQGLYRCEYEGNQLDYETTMKLLKTMQELRTQM